MNNKEADYLMHELNYSNNCIACESHKAVLEKRIRELIEDMPNNQEQKPIEERMKEIANQEIMPMEDKE